MSGTFMTVTEDTLGRLHLYWGSHSRGAPMASWHGFRSYQDLSDFFTFGLRGPVPVVDEITQEGRRGEYSRRTDDRVPPSLISSEVAQPVATVTDQAEASTASASASAQDAGCEVGAPGCDTT